MNFQENVNYISPNLERYSSIRKQTFEKGFAIDPFTGQKIIFIEGSFAEKPKEEIIEN